MADAAKVSLSNIGNGAASERFDLELSKVIANIRDINTDATKSRSITLKVTFMPHGDRVGMNMKVDCNSQLASIPSHPAGVSFILKGQDGDLNIYSHDIRQETLFKEPEPAPVVEAANVVSMGTRQQA
jgi:hypothetical protein